jgi:hypothetical protein
LNITVKPLSPTEWDIERGDVDFHVRLENDDYFVDAFDSSINDVNVSHLTTFICDEWKTVEAFVRDFNLKTRLPEDGYGNRCGHKISQ